MTDLKVEITDDDVSDHLAQLLHAGEDLDPALDAIGRVLKENIRAEFETSTDPYGNPWAPLKVRVGQPLLDTGVHLRDRVGYHVDGNSVDIGVPSPIPAVVHQMGATIEATNARALRFFVNGVPIFVGRGHKITIPARPIFPFEGLPDQWAQDILGALDDRYRNLWDMPRQR